MAVDDISNFPNELLKGFHTQFAENQRTREQSFIKIVGFLGAVVLGYAYVYQNLWRDSDAFSFVTLASIILLLSGAYIVVVIAYNFRRDQYVNARIRKRAEIIGKRKPFPEEYDPSHLYSKDKHKRYFWMPDLFTIFFHIFPVFQFLIAVSYYNKLNIVISFSNINWCVTVTLVLSAISFGLCFVILFCYSRKLRLRIQKWETEYNR
jgi:hypothetical protein